MFGNTYYRVLVVIVCAVNILYVSDVRGDM